MLGWGTTGDMSDALAGKEFKIDKREVQLPEAIKAIGEYPVTVKVFRDVTAQIKVNVEKEIQE